MNGVSALAPSPPSPPPLARDFYTRKLAEGGAVLAPMAGFSDAPFRRLCRRFGSAWAVTEMVSAKALTVGDERGLEISAPYEGERDLVIQVFGGEPEVVAAGGRLLYERFSPAALDLNMGCPVKKVTGRSCGAKLMNDPGRAAAIIGQLARAVPVPVSAKLRLGYDRVNALEVALALQEAGAALITIHGRTAAQKYTGEADWEAVAEIAARLAIPVVGSGDVTTQEQFRRYRAWGLGVMVGRGALGRPWVFRELRGEPAPPLPEIKDLILEHARSMRAWYGTDHAVIKMRGHLARYAQAFPEPEALRKALMQVSTLGALERVLACALPGA
ncbi:tRNA dihydrouridine synthase [Truepera radiovictrix]|nr:tRNA-dihydrouridine synthase family protein [Truepera radiovictrix]WMT56054.1 tRNA-dihydrouridine synthase family protein [Truepera radiovictrix]